jgi:transcriptional regulator with XRE-family HTH domain
VTPFGVRVRALRKQRRLTLKRMAADLQLSPAYLSALEHGRRGRPTWSLVQQIVEYLNIIWDEAEELHRLARISHPRIVIDTAGLEPEATELANRLASDIAALPRDRLRRLLDVLDSSRSNCTK